MLLKVLASLGAFFWAFLAAQPASAQLAIDRLWVDVDDGSLARSDLVLRNESKDIYYITVSPSEIVEPGTEAENRKTYSDPEDLGLLITPNRLILKPDEMRAVRIVSLNRDLTRDRVYRVNITPQIGELEFEQNSAEDRGLALKLLAAFDVLVTVRPKSSKANLYARRSGDKLTLGNDGTSNILLLDGWVCPAEGQSLAASTEDFYLGSANASSPADSEDAEEKPAPALVKNDEGCAKLPGRRMYAGNTWELAAAPSEYLKFQARRNADEDFRPLVIRCGSEADDSDLCRSGGMADADAKAANLSQTRPMEKL